MAPPSWRRAAAHLALFFTTVCFSAWNVLAESVTGKGLGALLICALRDTTSLLCLAATLLLRGRCRRHARARSGAAMEEAEACRTCDDRPVWTGPGSRRDWFLLAAVGLAGPFLSPLACILCVTWSSGDTSAILNALTPACAGLLATLFGFERPSWCLALALSLGTAAGLLAVGSPMSSMEAQGPTSGFAAGVIAGLVAVLCQGSFFVLLRPLQQTSRGRPPLDALTLITYAYAFAATASLATCLVAVEAEGFSLLAWLRSEGGRQLLLALYGGAVCGALSFGLITWASESVQASVCALYGVLQPPCTALMAFAAKGEALTMGGLASGALALLSLVCATAGPSLVVARREALCRPLTGGAEAEGA